MLSLVGVACAGKPTLYISGPSAAPVGEVAGYLLSINATCGGKVFGGPSDPTGIDCPATPHLMAVLEAACEGGACSIDSIAPPDQDGFIGVGVVGARAGETTLSVRVRAVDGSELTSTLPISFVVPTDLHVICDATLTSPSTMMRPSGQCGGHYPVFTDSGWRWKIAFASVAGDLPAPSVAVSVVGAGDVTASLAGSHLTLQSGPSVGMAEVQISSRQFTKNVPVRVVALADVATGELQMVSNAVATDGIDQEIAVLGPAPTTLWYADSRYRVFDGDTGEISIRPLLTLTDGSTVFGGAGLFASDHPDVLRLTTISGGGSPLQQTSLPFQVVSAGNAVANASVGAAQMTWAVQAINHLGM